MTEITGFSQKQWIHSVPTPKKAVAFTFDDGPDPTFTPELLDIFEAVNGKATFFMVGQQAEKHPELVQKVALAGHEVGNHTHTHPSLPELTDEEQRTELESTSELLKKLIQQEVRVFRAPYLAVNETVFQHAERLGMHSISAVNLDARDWANPGVEHIVVSTLQSMQPGGILLFHDGGGDRSQTVEAVRLLVQDLTEQGYALVTVSELMNGWVSDGI